RLVHQSCCVHTVHLFDIDIPGKITFQESKTLTAGQDLTVVDTGAHLLCYPGAFNMTTGPLHWELLQRARAADNQLLLQPVLQLEIPVQFGEVIATTEHDEATIIAEIDYSLIEQRRQFLPLRHQRRGDLYQLVDVQGSGSK
ncbi:hypothetical protein ZWY2020_030292, partial [Hordeum vulgare]